MNQYMLIRTKDLNTRFTEYGAWMHAYTHLAHAGAACTRGALTLRALGAGPTGVFFEHLQDFKRF